MVSNHGFQRKAQRTFKIPRNASRNHIEIHITEPNVKADNLPLETWASSTVLASKLHHLNINFPDTNSAASLPIVELGAGTGVVGLSAAAILDQPVILTDLPPIIPSLRDNIALNTDLLKTEVTAGVLDWTSRSELRVPGSSSGQDEIIYHSASTKAHVLLAADTLYSSEHPILLSQTVQTWLSRDPEARLVLGTAMRVAYLEELRELWERLEGIGLECIWDGKGMAEEADFDDERLVECSLWRWKVAESR